MLAQYIVRERMNFVFLTLCILMSTRAAYVLFRVKHSEPQDVAAKEQQYVSAKEQQDVAAKEQQDVVPQYVAPQDVVPQDGDGTPGLMPWGVRIRLKEI